MERDVMEFDVAIVGGGPAGLSAACKIKQLANEKGTDISVVVIEKGSDIGAHIFSGAVVEPSSLELLFPDWKEKGAPLTNAVEEDDFYFLRSAKSGIKLPNLFIPKPMHNKGNYIASVGDLCKWLAEQAENLGVDIFCGFTASELLYGDNDEVIGILTGDMGIDREGEPKDSFVPGVEIHAKYTLLTEGCRGHLGKVLVEKYDLNNGKDPQHYGLGIKETWKIPEQKSQPGLVVHGAGWPLGSESGGFFLYHGENNTVSVGLISDLNYKNPYFSPFEAFQQMKHHPVILQYLEGGERLSYGARAIAKGGFNSLPKMTAPGAMLLGCDAGTLNFSKIKGTHTAMMSGMLAAGVVAEVLEKGEPGGQDLVQFEQVFTESSLYTELFKARNFGPHLHRYGSLIGGALNYVDQNVVSLPYTLHDRKPDYDSLDRKSQAKFLEYPKPDNVISFDRLSSLFLSGVNHEENQPCHLILSHKNVPIDVNVEYYDEPAQRYCPAGVYEVLDKGDGSKTLQINAQNCLHCKTCDIKDPTQNITWTPPEGGGGPNYISQ
ncbi:electron transfer flavoprotein-ubiquinone oxidoreductase [Parasalinivibrio latis]|uniref:electron transfer flavoprotein-ubiquinone oxidoreductase n=1 Tax=Parasalinivibrio latis TaxID=2952610 RepID=UPI003DA4EAD1